MIRRAFFAALMAAGTWSLSAPTADAGNCGGYGGYRPVYNSYRPAVAYRPVNVYNRSVYRSARPVYGGGYGYRNVRPGFSTGPRISIGIGGGGVRPYYGGRGFGPGFGGGFGPGFGFGPGIGFGF